MTLEEVLRDCEKGWNQLKKLTGCYFVKKARQSRGRRMDIAWPPEKKGNYLHDISHGRNKIHESMADLDDCPACLYAISKFLAKKSRLDPFIFFIAWIIFKTRLDLNSANKLLAHLAKIDKGFDNIDLELSSATCRRYLKKIIEAAKALLELKETMLSEGEGFNIKIRQKAVDMGYQSAIKKEEKKIKSFQRSVDKKKGPDGTVSLRNIQRFLNLKIPPAIKKSGRDEIKLFNKYRLARFLEEMADKKFLDTKTGICKGKRKSRLRFRFSFPKKTCIKPAANK